MNNFIRLPFDKSLAYFILLNIFVLPHTIINLIFILFEEYWNAISSNNADVLKLYAILIRTLLLFHLFSEHAISLEIQTLISFH